MTDRKSFTPDDELDAMATLGLALGAVPVAGTGLGLAKSLDKLHRLESLVDPEVRRVAVEYLRSKGFRQTTMDAIKALGVDKALPKVDRVFIEGGPSSFYSPFKSSKGLQHIISVANPANVFHEYGHYRGATGSRLARMLIGLSLHRPVLSGLATIPAVAYGSLTDPDKSVAKPAIVGGAAGLASMLPTLIDEALANKRGGQALEEALATIPTSSKDFLRKVFGHGRKITMLSYGSGALLSAARLAATAAAMRMAARSAKRHEKLKTLGWSALGLAPFGMGALLSGAAGKHADELTKALSSRRVINLHNALLGTAIGLGLAGVARSWMKGRARGQKGDRNKTAAFGRSIYPSIYGRAILDGIPRWALMG